MTVLCVLRDGHWFCAREAQDLCNQLGSCQVNSPSMLSSPWRDTCAQAWHTLDEVETLQEGKKGNTVNPCGLWLVYLQCLNSASKRPNRPTFFAGHSPQWSNLRLESIALNLPTKLKCHLIIDRLMRLCCNPNETE